MTAGLERRSAINAVREIFQRDVASDERKGGGRAVRALDLTNAGAKGVALAYSREGTAGTASAASRRTRERDASLRGGRPRGDGEGS